MFKYFPCLKANNMFLYCSGFVFLLFTVSAVHFTSSSGQWSCLFMQQGKQYETRDSWEARGRYDTNPVLPFDLWRFWICVSVALFPSSGWPCVFFFPSKTQYYPPHTVSWIFYECYIEKRQHCFCRLIFSDMSLYQSHRTSTFCKGKNKKIKSRILMHHGNGEGVWKICGKKSEQIWFHSKYRMMNASCNLELQEISNPVLYSCAVL